MKQKLLYVASHLSTGGMPQYLLEQIRTFVNDYEIYVIEYANWSDEYVVQRDQIKDLIPSENYFLLPEGTGKHRPEIINVFTQVKPDIVHFQEPVSWFISTELIEQFLTLPDRPYYVVTPHNKFASPSSCPFIPDKYVLVSKWAYEKFKSLTDIPCDLWEYPIKTFPVNKKECQEILGLDPNYHHVLNVGLFTEGKNQGEIFEVAKLLKDKPIKFHFVGNQAINFKQYWGPLMDNKPDNCIVWGERADTDVFFQACDAFYFSSNLELFPIVIREALSYELPILMKKLETYLDVYDNNPKITFIQDNIKSNATTLTNLLQL